MLAGEGGNDRRTLRILLEAFCPEARGRIVEVGGPVRLRDAGEANLKARVSRLAGTIRARAEREKAEIGCVFVHEDFDAADGETGDIVRRRVQQALSRELGHSHYVLATWEVEAWLLLFPDALVAFASAWRLPATYCGRDTGRVSDPKRVMCDEVSKAGPKYRVSDAPAIFEKVVELGSHASPVGSNRSYDCLRKDAEACCATLGRRRR